MNIYNTLMEARPSSILPFGSLTPDQRDQVHPVFVVTPPGPPRQIEGEEPKLPTTPGAHLHKASDNIEANCKGMSIGVDLDAMKIAGPKEVVQFYRRLKQSGVNAVPVITASSLVDPFIGNTLLRMAGEMGGAWLRLPVSGQCLADSNQIISIALSQWSVPRENTKLILDMDQLSNIDLTQWEQGIIELLKNIPNLQSFGSVVLAAGSFPSKPKKIQADETISIAEYERKEYQLWRSIAGNPACPVHLDFGDYGPSVARFSSSGGGSGVWPKVIYTTESTWIVLRKRRASKGHVATAYRQLCHHLVSLTNTYDGPQFSSADETIYDISCDSIALSEPKTARVLAVSRHLCRTIHDLGTESVATAIVT